MMWRMFPARSRSLGRWAPTLALACACGDSPANGSSDTSGDTTASTSTSGTGSSSSADTAADFFVEPDFGPTVACDIYADTCPDNEKCTPYASDGGIRPDATKCIPLAEFPGGDESPCTVQEWVASGLDVEMVRQPVGVIGAITPFNFPAMIPLWFLPYAVACGNCFILKPSERVPLTAIALFRMLEQVGFPRGVVQLILGGKMTVDALLDHPGVQAISFVGSTPVAKHVYATAAATGKRVQSLGGAKNHAVVMPDADPASTADALLGAAFGSAGERCMAISAVVAVGSIGDSLVGTLGKLARSLKIGPGSTEGMDMGPLVTAAHRDRVAAYIDAGIKEGAQLVVDGRGVKVPGHEAGFFLGPTIFDAVTPDMTIYKDEIFGPVLVVLRVETLDEAIDLVNRNPYGNGTAIFTNSGGAAEKFEDQVEVGMVGVNVPIPVPSAFYSFGGWKQSLFGDLHVYGTEGVTFYTRTKAVTTRWPKGDIVSSGFMMPTTS